MIKSKDLLIELELIGTGNRPLIKSIRAIPFDIKTGAIVDDLELQISKHNCLSVFTKFEPEFLEYMLKGKIKDNSISGESLITVLTKLQDFCLEHIDENTKIWSTQKNFKIIHNLYEHIFNNENKLIWDQSNELDINTMLFLSKKIKTSSILPEGHLLRTISILSQTFNKL